MNITTKYVTACTLFICLIISIPVLLNAHGTVRAILDLTITNNHGRSQTLRIGVDEDATNAIDPDLGESELPPIPPSEIFDARFTAPSSSIKLGEGSLVDLRPPQSLTANFTEQYRISYHAGKNYQNASLLFPSTFPSQIKQVKVDGKIVNAGDSVVTQFGTGDISISIEYNFTNITFVFSPPSLTFKISNQDKTLPFPQTVSITPSVDNIYWYAETDQSWISLSATFGTGSTNLSIGLSTLSFFDGITSGTVSFFVNPEAAPSILTINVDYTTGVGSISSGTDFKLEQNYPNPVSLVSSNSITQISFDLGQMFQTNTTPLLKVYDQFGRIVADLSSMIEKRNGIQKISFDTHAIASGVYTYRLINGNSASSRNMIIVK